MDGPAARMRIRYVRAGWLAVAIVAPALLTSTLLYLGGVQGRDYVFLYMGLVAATALGAGLIPSLVSAAASFVMVDWFFVPPQGTLTVSNEQDIINLFVFFGTASLVGMLASIRRQNLIRTQELARQLQDANQELVRLNREQAEAAKLELRLARTEQQVKTLQERDREQRELIADVSHDLRTPLGTILTASTGLLRRPGLEPDVHDTLQTVASEVRRLNHMVANTLDLARIESGVIRLDLEAVSLVEATVAAVDRLHRTSPGRIVEHEAELDATVLADWGRLGQVLDNLIANADHHSPTDKPIRVIFEQPEMGFIRTRVIDFGPGVSPALRARLFERFAQSPNRPGDQGTGLGLAIVRGLVQAQAGTVVYEDAPGGGASFAFTLPRAETDDE